MSEQTDILPHSIAFDSGIGELDALLKDVPAKWVVYLMADAENRPVQLLCVKNLRYSLMRQLSDGQTVGLSKRINYRELVRHIHWRRVFSAFEADAVYLEAARHYFPQTYRGMTGFQPAWFIHVNPDAGFPRYTKTIDLDIKSGQLIGPLEDKHSAGKLMEDVADWFDLCRYYNILIESPNARACAYKEMGKCPAPCDGSISMENYRHLMRWSAEAIVAPQELIADATLRMKQAAGELRFEIAGKIKAYVDSLSQLGKGSYRYLRKLRDFNFLAIQRGPRENTAKIFLIVPGQIFELFGLIDLPKAPDELLDAALKRAADFLRDSADPIAAERIGIVTHHLFQPKAIHGVFLSLHSADGKSIAKAFQDVQKQKKEDIPAENEGVIKELQMM